MFQIQTIWYLLNLKKKILLKKLKFWKFQIFKLFKINNLSKLKTHKNTQNKTTQIHNFTIFNRSVYQTV